MISFILNEGNLIIYLSPNYYYIFAILAWPVNRKYTVAIDWIGN